MVFSQKKQFNKRDKKAFLKNDNKKTSFEIIYGKNACFGCVNGFLKNLNNREIYEIYVLQNKFEEINKKIPQKLRNKIKQVNNSELFRLTHEQDKHQGIAIKVSNFKFSDINDLLNEGIEKENIGNLNNQSNIFLLDRVQDPQNFGNIIRTSFCFGINGIIIPQNESCSVTPAVVRSSAGYSEESKIYKVANINNAIEKLKKIGYTIIGFDVNTNAKADISTIIQQNQKILFIFGSEGNGIKELTKKNCDFLIKLPMVNDAESMNVANTATIVAWEIMKSRT